MVNKVIQLAEMQETFKKEMIDLTVLLKDPKLEPGRKASAMLKLKEIEDLLVFEIDDMKGNTEVRRRDLKAEIERETQKRKEGGSR
jgi:hypothetical protein